MANTIDGTAKEHWMPRLQRKLRENLVTRIIANVSTRPDRVFHNPFSSEAAGTDGNVTSPSYTVNDFTTTDNTLAVNRRAVAAEHVDSIERLQSNYDLVMDRADSQGYIVSRFIDQYVLNKPVGLSGVTRLDDDDLGAGSDGDPYQLTDTNVDNVLVELGQNLGLNNVDPTIPKFWVVSDYELSKMKLYLMNNGFRVADNMIEGNIRVGQNGLVGVTPDNIRIIKSNLITQVTNVTLGTNASADQTVTISAAGTTVTFTAKATPAAAGEFDIGGDNDATGAIIANAINNASTGQDSATGYFQVSASDRRFLDDQLQVSATYTAGTNVLSITTKHVCTVATTITNGSVANPQRHTLYGEFGSIFAAVPSDGLEYEVKSVGQKHGRELESSQVYEATVWEKMKPGVLDVVLYT